jgi:hypothetical protein
MGKDKVASPDASEPVIAPRKGENYLGRKQHLCNPTDEAHAEAP